MSKRETRGKRRPATKKKRGRPELWTPEKCAEFEEHVRQIKRAGDNDWWREQLDAAVKRNPELAAFKAKLENPQNKDLLAKLAFEYGPWPDQSLASAQRFGLEPHTWEAEMIAIILKKSGRYPNASVSTLAKYVLEGPTRSKRRK
jgi:hypothetical protein